MTHWCRACGRVIDPPASAIKVRPTDGSPPWYVHPPHLIWRSMACLAITPKEVSMHGSTATRPNDRTPHAHLPDPGLPRPGGAWPVPRACEGARAAAPGAV